jgi:hypothetical protein
MPTTIEHDEEVARNEKKKKSQPPPPPADAELEPVTIDDLNERTERARREGGSGE